MRLVQAAHGSFKRLGDSFSRRKRHSHPSSQGTVIGQSVRTFDSETQWDEMNKTIFTKAMLNKELRQMCASGKIMKARQLIDAGANVNSFDEAFERTPLHHAAVNGHDAVVQMLIARGANIRAHDLNDQEPLHLAAERGWTGVIEILVRDFNADLTARTANGSTAFHYAAYGNHVEAMKVLLRLGLEKQALVTRRESESDGAFWAPGGSIERIDFSNFKDNYGKTPVHIAMDRHHKALVRLFESDPASLRAAKAIQTTPGATLKKLDELKQPSPRTRPKFKGFGPVGAGG